MIFYVDYENVHNEGMDGIDYLNEQDIMYIFYSQAAPNIKKYYLQVVNSNNINVELRKLKNIHKNGIDFYIASQLGADTERYNDDFSIISNDKGYEAVREYWTNASPHKYSIFLSDSIKNAIAQMDDSRGRLVRESELVIPVEKMLNITKTSVEYKEETKKTEEHKLSEEANLVDDKASMESAIDTSDQKVKVSSQKSKNKKKKRKKTNKIVEAVKETKTELSDESENSQSVVDSNENTDTSLNNDMVIDQPKEDKVLELKKEDDLKSNKEDLETNITSDKEEEIEQNEPESNGKDIDKKDKSVSITPGKINLMRYSDEFKAFPPIPPIGFFDDSFTPKELANEISSDDDFDFENPLRMFGMYGSIEAMMISRLLIALGGKRACPIDICNHLAGIKKYPNVPNQEFLDSEFGVFKGCSPQTMLNDLKRFAITGAFKVTKNMSKVYAVKMSLLEEFAYPEPHHYLDNDDITSYKDIDWLSFLDSNRKLKSTEAIHIEYLFNRVYLLCYAKEKIKDFAKRSNTIVRNEIKKVRITGDDLKQSILDDIIKEL